MQAINLATELAETVRQAAARRTPLAIRGAGSKRFLTGVNPGTPLDVTGHRGIVSYEPTELVLTARAGTPLTDIEQALADQNQMLGFEPPHYGPGATLGGTIACGLSGPRRPFAGAARDFVLGTRIINGRGEVLTFGGQVMKNVAGFDVSRLMTGSLGTLGVLLDISLKVLPKPPDEITLTFETPADRAIHTMNSWAAQPLPLSAAAYAGDTLYIRLSGTESALRVARARLGGEALKSGTPFWETLREHHHAFFRDATPLWRLSVPPATAPLAIEGRWILDWGGAQRWLKSAAPAGGIMQVAREHGGHARCIGPTHHALSPMPESLQRLNAAVRTAFDPQQIFAVPSG